MATSLVNDVQENEEYDQAGFDGIKSMAPQILQSRLLGQFESQALTKEAAEKQDVAQVVGYKSNVNLLDKIRKAYQAYKATTAALMAAMALNSMGVNKPMPSDLLDQEPAPISQVDSPEDEARDLSRAQEAARDGEEDLDEDQEPESPDEGPPDEGDQGQEGAEDKKKKEKPQSTEEEGEEGEEGGYTDMEEEMPAPLPPGAEEIPKILKQQEAEEAAKKEQEDQEKKEGKEKGEEGAEGEAKEKGEGEEEGEGADEQEMARTLSEDKKESKDKKDDKEGEEGEESGGIETAITQKMVKEGIDFIIDATVATGVTIAGYLIGVLVLNLIMFNLVEMLKGFFKMLIEAFLSFAPGPEKAKDKVKNLLKTKLTMTPSQWLESALISSPVYFCLFLIAVVPIAIMVIIYF
ncbi:MAG: hypothetical protein ABID45_00260 [Patescibacteria group bacterium]